MAVGAGGEVGAAIGACIGDGGGMGGGAMAPRLAMPVLCRACTAVRRSSSSASMPDAEGVDEWEPGGSSDEEDVCCLRGRPDAADAAAVAAAVGELSVMA